MTIAGRPLRRWLIAIVVTLGAVETAGAQQTASPPPGLFSEPRLFGRIGDIVQRKVADRDTRPADGFFLDPGRNMVTGSGWVAAGPGYRHRLFDGRAIFTGSAEVSWRLYSDVTARLDVPGLLHGHGRIGVRTSYEDALQLNYFGLGNHSSRHDRSGYRFRGADLSVDARWTSGRALTVSGRAGWLAYADVSRMAGRDPEYPDVQDLFTGQTAPGLRTQPGFLHADVSVESDTRDAIADPSRGGYYRASGARYIDRDTGRFTFGIYELEAARYVTVVRDKIVLAGNAWTVMTSSAPGHEVPFYLMPNLGGKNTLRGFADYRYFDRDMEAISVEARVRLYAHLDVAALVDTGKVASRVRDLGASDLHTDVGVGVRFRTRDITIGRLDVGTSVEGWHFVFQIDEPFRRKKRSGGFPTVAPFVP